MPSNLLQSLQPQRSAAHAAAVFSPRRLALGELEALARPLLAVLLAFLHAGIAREQSGAAQFGAELGVDQQQRAGDAERDRAALAGDAAPMNVGQHIVLPVELDGDQGTVGQQLTGWGAEIGGKSATVDLALAAAGTENDTGHRALAPSGGLE